MSTNEDLQQAERLADALPALSELSLSLLLLRGTTQDVARWIRDYALQALRTQAAEVVELKTRAEKAERMECLLSARLDQHALAEQQQSRTMFVARLENMEKNGDKWLSVSAVLALLNDCDMLAAAPSPNKETP